MSLSSIESLLRNFKNANLSLTPTPIYKLTRLSPYLGHNIYVMRDDQTGFALGGNKVRKLDYLIGDALNKKSTTLITSGSSSFSRNAAAAGATFGLDLHVFIFGKEDEQNKASRSYFEIFGTKLHFIPRDKKETLPDEQAKLKKKLEKEGQIIYELHPGGSDEIGTLSYVKAFEQIVRYSSETNIRFNKIIHTTGSTATQAGLVLGQCISGYETTIIGMAISQKTDYQKMKVRMLAKSTAKMHGFPYDEGKVIVDDGFIGAGYPIPSKEGHDAIKLFATKEGILLAEAYTAKSAAGLIHYAKNGMFAKDDNILFIHTGGNSGLYD